MKKLVIILPILFSAGYLFAQRQDAEAEIKSLEQLEVKAVLAKDTVTLKTLWDKDYVVQNPENKIVLAMANSVSRPVLNKARTLFTREPEHITINGNIAISMGNETVVPGGDATNPGETVRRRYTNVWIKTDSGWKLIARHANIICQGK